MINVWGVPEADQSIPWCKPAESLSGAPEDLSKPTKQKLKGRGTKRPCCVLNVPACIIHHPQITCSPSTLLVTVSAFAMQSTPLILFIEGLICTAGHHFVYSLLSLLPLMKTMKNFK